MKRSSYSKKKSPPKRMAYGKKSYKPFFKRSATVSTPSKSIYSAMTPHYFRRQLDDGVFYCSGLNTISVVNALGSAPTWLSLGTIATDQGGVTATGQYGFSISPALSMVVNSTEFSNLFQQYQLTRLTIQIRPVNGNSAPNAVAQLMSITIAEDFNDATAPASYAGIQQNESAKTFLLTDECEQNFSAKPVAAVAMYSGGAFAGYSTQARDNWIDCTAPSNSVPHYVFKGYVRNQIVSGANTGQAFRITPTLYMRFRGTH